MTLTVSCILSLLVAVTSLTGCRPVFDMAIYEDGLTAAYERRGNNIAATTLLNQSIVSSELVSATIPPGVYADHGILLYHEGKVAEAVEQITKEGVHYPESKRFIRNTLSVIQETEGQQEASQLSPHRTPSILVLPPINKTGKPEAGPAFEMTLSLQFVERGYYVFPILATQVLLHGAGVKLTDISGAELSFMKTLTGADAVLSVTISEWENTWMVIPLIRVAAEYRLVDATTGRDIWKCAVRDEFDPTVSGGVGGPVYAVIKDLRRPARLLTKKAITSTDNELPYGPYH